jgi:hypothetical protein
LHLRVNLRKGSRSICRGLEARAKAKEFARLTVVAKSLRDGRQYRKLAEMYWALALGEEPEPAKPFKTHVKRSGCPYRKPKTADRDRESGDTRSR